MPEVRPVGTVAVSSIPWRRRVQAPQMAGIATSLTAAAIAARQRTPGFP